MEVKEHDINEGSVATTVRTTQGFVQALAKFLSSIVSM